MKKSEELLKLAEDNSIEIIDVFIDDEKLEGLYADNTVLINTIVKENKYNEVLGHELGHHFTLEGNNREMTYRSFVQTPGVIKIFSH